MRTRWLLLAPLLLPLACTCQDTDVESASEGEPNVSVVETLAATPAPPEPQPSAAPQAAAESIVSDAPEIVLNQPRPFATIWVEVIHRRQQIDRLVAQDDLLPITEICGRYHQVLRELFMASRDLDRTKRIELSRALEITRNHVNHVHDIAREQIPGRMPLALWDMDLAFVALEELLPEGQRGGNEYPRPAPQPPA